MVGTTTTGGTAAASVLIAGPEDKEAMRLEARRQREQERNKKLGPGRLRSIGADIAGVRNQIEDKQREAEAARAATQADDEEAAAIRRYLLQVESEDAVAKRRELLTLRNDWHLQAAEKERARALEAQFRAQRIDPETCPPGAAQKFAGEDRGKLERERLQALQLQQWVAAQVQERRDLNAAETNETLAYARYLAEVERLQAELQHASDRDRAQLALELRRCNQDMMEARRAAERRARDDEQRANAADIQYALQSNLISENPLQAQLPGGVPLDRRVRVDHWKGLSGEETKRFLAQNDALLAEKAQRERDLKEEEAENARRQRELHRILTADEHTMAQQRAAQQLQVRDTLDAQRAAAAKREQDTAAQARGHIEPSFFQGFGRSYR